MALAVILSPPYYVPTLLREFIEALIIHTMQYNDYLGRTFFLLKEREKREKEQAGFKGEKALLTALSLLRLRRIA